MADQGRNEWERRYEASIEAQERATEHLRDSSLETFRTVEAVVGVVIIVIALVVAGVTWFLKASTTVHVVVTVAAVALAIGAGVMLWMYAKEQQRTRREEFERRPPLRRTS